MLRLDVILNDLVDKIWCGLIPVRTYRLIDPHSSKPVYKAARQKVNEAYELIPARRQRYTRNTVHRRSVACDLIPR